jgi:Protein of unknown function (DUF3302)
MLPSAARAAFLHGEALDTMADYIAWGVLVIAPVVAIGIFWFVHIIPEKIAEQKRHPQAKAIQALCLLSLFFGGLLWPLALLWAYSKPVLHKMAYGTDVWDHATPQEVGKEPAEPLPVLTTEAPAPAVVMQAELQRLKEQVERLSQRVPTLQEVEAVRAQSAIVEAAATAKRARQGG